MAPNSIAGRFLLIGLLGAASSALWAGGQDSAEPLTLSLKKAVELAVRQNPRLQVANLRVLEAEGESGVVRSALRPQFNASLGSAYQTTNLRALGFTFPGIADQVGPFQQFDVRPSLSQSVFDLSLRKSVLASSERVREAHWSGVSLRESTILAVVQLYLEVLEADARLESSTARLRTAEALLKQARDFVGAGTASHLDEARARFQFETERRMMIEIQQERDIKKLLLLNVIGLEPDVRLELTDRLRPPSAQPVLDPEALETAVAKRPETHSVEARLKASVAEREKAAAQRYPTVGVGADFGRFGNSLANNTSTYAIRMNVRFPIFQGGRIEAEIRAADAKVKQVEEELRETRLRARTDLRVARIEVLAADQAYEAAHRAGASARASLELATARFEGGFSNNIEVVAAQEAVISAEAGEIRCLYHSYLARAHLTKAQGNIMALFE